MIRDETIEAFKRRVDDKIVEGRNRTRIVLGTDRKDTGASGYGSGGDDDPESGTIDVVAGTAGPDPDYDEDKSRLYLSGKTNPDEYFEINAEEKLEEVAAGVLKSDNVYIIGREKIKIVHGDFHIILDQDSVRIAKNDGMSIVLKQDNVTIAKASGNAQPPIRGDDFERWAKELTVLSPMGPLKINELDIQKIRNIKSSKMKIE